ncbi:MAG: SGNH/GDSL hydrolase family protein [Chloroflexi bacterium]|nr:SGNH/GDSL hydrolase family protein [Chloroflexota bacterium]
MIHSLPSLHVVGDSISIQYGPYLEKMLTGVMAYSRKTGTTDNLDNPEGANGGDSSMVIDYVRTLQNDPRAPFDYLMVNCGLHDLRWQLAEHRFQIPLEQYGENLATIVRLSKPVARQMIWVRTTPVVDQIHNKPGMDFNRFARNVDEYNSIADQVMRANQVPLIDLFAFTRNLGDDIYCDHAHFRDEVRAQQAAFIAGYLSVLKTRFLDGNP